MVTDASLTPLLLTVDRMLAATGTDPATVSDNDKVLIATQCVDVMACHGGVAPCGAKDRCEEAMCRTA